MKIYIIPYTFRNKVLFSKRASGVDESMLKQFTVLKELGHDVRVFVPFGDIHKHFTGVDIFNEKIPDDIKKFESANKDQILNTMIKNIQSFKPDVIISNFTFGSKPYGRLMELNIPILFWCHAIPGFFSDLMSADLLRKFHNLGNSITVVSNYHKQRFMAYYGSNREMWKITESITPDFIIPPTYCTKPEVIQPADGFVRHVSAANKGKNTFFIHKAFSNTSVPTEVFTTISYLGGQLDEYVTKGVELYSDKTRFDVDHDTMMEVIPKSTACFVGLAPYDTFTITSLESLSRGVPLFLKGYKGQHPAYEMVDPSMHKFLCICKNTKEMVDQYHKFSLMTLEDRKNLAKSAYDKFSKDVFKDKLEGSLEKVIRKYEEYNKKQIDVTSFIS